MSTDKIFDISNKDEQFRRILLGNDGFPQALVFRNSYIYFTIFLEIVANFCEYPDADIPAVTRIFVRNLKGDLRQ